MGHGTVMTSDSGEIHRELDGTDLALIECLQISPRAGHRALAEALDVSVPTVSRRITRLRSRGVLRFTVQVPDWVHSDTHPQHVWVVAHAGAAPQVATAIAALPQARYVAVTSGRSDVYCILDAPRRQEMAELLTRGLPGIDGVVSTASELGLDPYANAPGWRLHRLGTDTEKALGVESASGVPTPVEVRLSDEERAVVAVLQADGRATAADVTRSVDLSSSTAYRMIQSLLRRDIVVPRLEVEPALLGFPLEVVVSLVAEPGRMTELATTLAGYPSARYVATVAGHSSVLYHGVFSHEDALATFLSTEIASLPGVSALEVSIVLQVVTRYWTSRVQMPYGP